MLEIKQAGIFTELRRNDDLLIRSKNVDEVLDYAEVQRILNREQIKFCKPEEHKRVGRKKKKSITIHILEPEFIY